MAVLDIFPGITAEIFVGGSPAQEYDDEDELQVQHDDRAIAKYQISRTVSKYIQSQTGQTFSIKFSAGAPYVKGKNMEHVKLGFHVYVDGKLAGKVWLSRPFFKKHEEGTLWMEEMKGVKEGKGKGCTVREFRFACIESQDIDNSDAAKIKRLAQRIRSVGTIEIRVYHEGNAKNGGENEASTKGFLDEKGTVVPESALKGDSKSHGTALGQAKKAKRGDFFRTTLKDGEDYPLIIFRFLYRDEEALKQMHIKTRTPSPSLTPTSSPSPSPPPEPERSAAPAELTAEQQAQVAELLRRLTQENAQKAAAERAASTGGKKKESDRKRAQRIKRERGEEHKEKMRADKRAKTRREGKEGKAAPVFVDLTGGDEDGGGE